MRSTAQTASADTELAGIAAFVKVGVENLINLQREGSMAKPYQVRQLRKSPDQIRTWDFD
jgi:hypothetical protein